MSSSGLSQSAGFSSDPSEQSGEWSHMDSLEIHSPDLHQNSSSVQFTLELAAGKVYGKLQINYLFEIQVHLMYFVK